MGDTRDSLRRYWPLLVAPPCLALVAAAIYLAATPTRYEAQAKLLVSPVATDDDVLLGFGVLRESGDGRRVVESAAELVETPEVADKVKLQLGLEDPRPDVLEMVSAHPIGDSNVVAVVGRAGDAERAVQVANAFAQETVAERTARFQSDLLAVTRRLAEQLRATPPAQRSSPGSLQLERRLASLRALVSTRDPTIQQISSAVPPQDPATPRAALVVPAAALIGLLFGLGAFLAAGLTGRRSETELSLEERLARLQWELALREAPESGPERASADPGAAKRLEQRIAAVTTRERELAQRVGSVAARERELEEREAALAALSAELEERDAASRRRSAELERSRAAATEQSAELERREEAVARAEAGQAPRRGATVAAPGDAAREHAAAAGDAERGRWNLETLSRLVETRGADFPRRVEEWNSYLFFLRSHADAAGRLPQSFDWLVEETFGELLDDRPAIV